MLGAIRKSVKSWVGITILALALGALVLTLFYGQAPGPSQTAAGREVARAGNRVITDREFQAAVSRAFDRQRQESPDLSMTDFVQLGGADLVFEQLLVGRALQAFADKAGIPIGKRAVDGEIASLPAAQVAGKFDEGTFRRLLEQQRVSEAELRDDIAGAFARRALLRPAVLGSAVPESLTAPYAELFLEERSGTILAIPSALMPEPEAPSEEALERFWRENRAAWTVPERRVWRYAIVERQQVTPTEKEVRAYYDANPGEFGGIEQRRLSQVVLQDEKAARDFVARVRGGQAFATAAQAAGFAPTDTALGVLTREALAAQANAAVADAAFAAAEGTVADPARGPFGWHVILVERVVPASLTPFEAARQAIFDKLALERTETAYAERIAAIEDRLEEGAPLAEVAKEFGLTLAETEPTTASEQKLDAANMLVASDAPLVTRAFAADPADGAIVVDAGRDRFAVLEVTEVIAPAPIPLADIRDRVLAAWRLDARQRAARSIAEEVAAGDGDLDAAARQHGLPPPERLRVRRLELTQMAGGGQQIPPPVLMLLSLKAGGMRVAPAPGGQGWYVVRTEETKRGDPEEARQLQDFVRQSMSASAANEMAETFARVIQRAVGATRRPAEIAAVKRRLAGEAAGAED
ncbi:MAG: peptidylprolyl isomerase [Sphingomonadaceae bacterium]